jgi:hypothetical protein
MRQAAAGTPLPAMPLAVLAHVRPFDRPGQAEGLQSDMLERVFRAANEWLVTLGSERALLRRQRERP